MSFVSIGSGIQNRNHPNSDVNVLLDSCPSQFVSLMKESYYFGDIQSCEGGVTAHHIVFISLLFDVGDRDPTVDNGFFFNGSIVDLLLWTT